MRYIHLGHSDSAMRLLAGLRRELQPSQLLGRA
jgi:hypothetical protein